MYIFIFKHEEEKHELIRTVWEAQLTGNQRIEKMSECGFLHRSESGTIAFAVVLPLLLC